MTCDAMYMLG